MSTVKVQGNAGGTGSITLASPNTNNNRTIELPDVDGTAVVANSSGNVGIGTSSPSAKLTVQGSTGNGIIYTDTTVSAYMGTSGSALAEYGTLTNHPMRWLTNGTERARIDSSGNLLVGTTSSGTVGAGLVVNYASGNGTYLDVGHPSGAGNGYGYIRFLLNNSIIGQISQNGTTGVTYATSSDYRLKENVQPMTGALSVVQALKPCTYTWKADGSSGQGFIAHELQEVVPDCVTGEKDAVDENGNPVYQGIDTSFLVATLTAAIQELNAKVEAQAAEIAALKGAA